MERFESQTATIAVFGLGYVGLSLGRAAHEAGFPVVGYDRDRDSYRLRATAPLPTGRMELHIPARFVGGVSLLGDAVRGEDDDFEGERLLVIEHPGEAISGRSVAAQLEGLAGRDSLAGLLE